MVSQYPFFKLSYRWRLTVIFCGLFLGLLSSQALSYKFDAVKTDPPPKPRFEEGQIPSNERPDTPWFDKFGGSKKFQLEATGYWRIGQVMDREMLITPLGSPFSIVSITGVSPANYDDDSYEAVYFGRETAWGIDTGNDLLEWHINTIGIRSRLDLLIGNKVQRFPYITSLEILKPEAMERTELDYPDPWDPIYKQRVVTATEEMITKHGDDEYWIGLMGPNEPYTCLRTMMGEWDPLAKWWWILLKPELGHDDALHEFAILMEELYENIDDFNNQYGTTLTSFDEIETLGLEVFNRFTIIEGEEEEEAAPQTYRDIMKWNAKITGQLHTLVWDAVKERRPQTIIFSAAINNAFCDEEIIASMKGKVEVVTLNHYVSGENPVPDRVYSHRFADILEVPIFYNEFSFSVPPYDLGIYPHVGSQTERGEAYTKYLHAALADPKVLGASWFTLVDPRCLSYALCNEEIDHINFGIYDRFLNKYQEMVDAAALLYQDYYEISLSPVRGIDSGGAKIPLVPTGTHQREFWGPPDPIGHDKALWYDLDPLVPIGHDQTKWFDFDPPMPIGHDQTQWLDFDPPVPLDGKKKLFFEPDPLNPLNPTVGKKLGFELIPKSEEGEQ